VQEIVETYFSRVFLTPTEAFKTKKPVRLRAGRDSVDLTKPETRRTACLEELRLNRRLSASVYRGVVLVDVTPDGRLLVGEPGPEADWSIRMRRLPDRDRADRRLQSGSLDDAMVHAIARQLAAFHETAPTDPGIAAEGRPRALHQRVDLRIESPDTPPREALPVELERAEAWQHGFLEEHAERFEARAGAGSIREGHGDLSLDHVFVDDAGRVHVIDALEAAPHLRRADGVADVALLATDIATRGRTDLAERLIAEYARVANDFDLYPLLDFYSSLRATTRGKLEWFFADSLSGAYRDATERRERARRFFLLALAAPRRPLLPPAVVAMGGQVASGKSTVASHIAHRIGAPIVSSDATRDFLLGGRVNEHLHEVRWELAYEAGFPDRIYDEVMRRAGAVLESGRPVVVDGCFSARRERERARALAERFGRPFLFVEASVSEAVQRERLRERSLRDGEPDSTWQRIADDLRARWEPADELGAAEHLALDTALPLDWSAARIEEALPTWPEGLTG